MVQVTLKWRRHNMNGLQLLEWLQEIPKESLAVCRVVLEVGTDNEELVTAKYYTKPPEPQPTIYLIHK